ncbi:hypothetical protein BS47DRAFT_1345262 [Hydnum rufescens UP504]|uniref:SPT23/MGA2-like DNA-binding domain-containing protein n=1 Tax=Hydnum rufescens UP504 TaxID=1448309 RepID=A0A9P6AV11_9AGAM|nr:hypothetical protein BS47DRAFT_1345262 [Hydnum rufescens UP504]
MHRAPAHLHPLFSPASSDFLPSDTALLTNWSTYANSPITDPFDEDRKPSFDHFAGLDLPDHSYQALEDPGMLLEDLMQEDAYETNPINSTYFPSSQPLPPAKFEPTLPALPSYPSPPASDDARQPLTVHVPPSDESPAPSSPKTRFSIEANSFESSSLQNLLVTTPNAPVLIHPSSPHHEHPYQSCLPILIHNVPSVGAKSRVETQIKMTLDLALPTDPALSAYERVGSWKWLRLPKGSSTRRRPRKECKPEAQVDETLTLSVAVTCASDPSMPVSACTNCLAREAKRTERKKAARDSEDDIPRNSSPKSPIQKDGGGIVVFNWSSLPVRVTCYCRHHREKLGFRIAFTMADTQGRVVGRGSTPPIMITDDHKSVMKNPLPTPAVEEPEEQPKRKRRLAKDAPDPENEPRSKRRAKEPSPAIVTPKTIFQSQSYAHGNDSSPSISHATVPGHTSQSPSTFTTAPSSPQIISLPSPLGVYLHYPVTNDNDTFMQTPEELDVLSASLAAASAASAELRNPTSPPNAFSPSTLFNTTYPSPSPSSRGPPPGPQIHRLIPASGPTHGGIEVTMWSENTLVCLLPPSACPGPVVVSFEGIPLAVGGGAPGDGRILQLFNYLDNSDRALMELALQVVGLKMTGRIEEAKNVAMRIVGNNTNGGPEPSSMTSTGLTSMNNLVADAEAVAHSVHSRAGSDSESTHLMLSSSSSRDFQSVIIEFLYLLDVDVPTTSVVTTHEAVSHPNDSGQTLLHLSAILGFHHLLKHLISHGIDLDARDANGYTALHFAALCGRLACARILVEGGADVEIVEARGRTAREIAKWRDQVDVEILLEDIESRLVFGSTSNGDEADESDIEGLGMEDSFYSISPTMTIRPSGANDIDHIRYLSDSGDSGSEDNLLESEPQYEEKKLPLEPSPPSLFHRTLSHLQPPPLPTLPAMPGLPMPQWGLFPNQLQLPQLQFPQLPHLPHFPDIPMVFPVQMPTPSWPANFPWQAGPAQSGKPEHVQQQQGQGMLWGAYGLASPWLGFYPGRGPPPNPEKEQEQEPPMYTPPAPAGVAVPDPLVPPPSSAEPVQSSSLGLTVDTESSSELSIPKPSLSTKSAKLARRAGYKQTRFEERDIRAYEDRSKKVQKLKSTSICLLQKLWIVLGYGLYQGVPVVLTTVYDVAAWVLPEQRIAALA